VAKLHFYYSAMNAGKSTVLLQSSYNYEERGMHTLLYSPDFDNRFGERTIASRIGLKAKAHSFSKEFNIFKHAENAISKDNLIKCVLIDEAQFLTKQQVKELTDITDYLDVPVLAYGLRTDFMQEPFEGSMYLLAWADNLIELKTICHCGKKAIMTIRVDKEGKALSKGDQIEIAGNERYISVCRKHHKSGTVEM